LSIVRKDLNAGKLEPPLVSLALIKWMVLW